MEDREGKKMNWMTGMEDRRGKMSWREMKQEMEREREMEQKKAREEIHFNPPPPLSSLSSFYPSISFPTSISLSLSRLA